MQGKMFDFFNGLKVMSCVALIVTSHSVFAKEQPEAQVNVSQKSVTPHVWHIKGSTAGLDRNGWFVGEQIEVKLNQYDTEGRYSIMDFTFPKCFDSSPGHWHARHAETFILTKGRMEWMVEGEKKILKAGDLIYIPPNTLHSAKTLDNKPVQAIFISDPAGWERSIPRRNELTEEQLKDPAYMDKFNESIDYMFDPLREHDHNK